MEKKFIDKGYDAETLNTIKDQVRRMDKKMILGGRMNDTVRHEDTRPVLPFITSFST